MKAEDLMVGDILQNENTDYVLIRSVANTAEKDFCIVEVLDGVHPGDIQRVHCEDLTPIQLTLEILEKNGWVFDEIDGSYQHPDLGFWIGGRSVPFGFMVSWIYKELYYVHELQHALRLCEIDKKIVL